MNGDSFLDTNIFVYSIDEADDRKHKIASELIDRLLEDKTGCVSYQVVQETINVMTRKHDATQDEIQEMLDDTLRPFWRVDPSPGLYMRGLELRARYGFSFYDSLIVAAALEADCARLYTEDMQHGQRIESLTIENPFRG